jgi:chromosomal replication initiator protein
MVVTASRAGFTLGELVGRSRTGELALVRQVAMTVCRQYTDASFPAIARAFGRDHTTVFAAIGATEARMTPDLREAMDRIAAECQLQRVVR